MRDVGQEIKEEKASQQTEFLDANTDFFVKMNDNQILRFKKYCEKLEGKHHQ